MNYSEFINSKSQSENLYGFDPVWMPDFLFDFQRSLVEWSLKKGRGALFCDCGLGKSPMLLTFAQNVVKKTNKRVLVLTPLSVSYQMVREGEKFGIEVTRCDDGKFPNGKKIIVTNYERLHYFNREDFVGVILDESSILKNFKGEIKRQVTDFMCRTPYRLICTATPSPNDYIELGTSSECLGDLGYIDMLAMFFKSNDNTNAQGGSQRTRHKMEWGGKFRFRGHAECDFWRWVCSWSRACRKPSDLGFSDDKFKLPKLITKQHEVKANSLPEGFLFEIPAHGLKEQREELARTVQERCEMSAKLATERDEPSVVWCNLNKESDILKRIIPNSVEVKGSDSDEHKEEAFRSFQDGKIQNIITKPTIAGFGLNWQHCAHQTFFPSHSFEQWYQAIRRSWRFGQKRPVTIDVVTTEGQSRVLANMQAKSQAAEKMFDNLVSMMNNELKIERKNEMTNKEEIPSWL